MSSPLDDPRASALVNSSPAEVDGLATQFSTVATEAQDAIDGLHGAHGDAQWTGKSADAFRKQLGKLPGDLGKVHESYAYAAHALRVYGQELGPIQRQFQALAPQLQSAQSNLTTAQGDLSTAKTNLNTAKSQPKATSTSPGVTSASSAVTTAQGGVGRYGDEVSGLSRQLNRLLDDFDHHRHDAVSAVDHARSIAPEHHSSFWGGVAHFFSSAGHFLANVGKGIGESFKNVFDGHDIIQFIEHPSWKTFGQLAKDVGTVAGTIAAVVAPFAAPELLAADGAAEATDVAAEGGAEAAGELASNGAADTATDTASTFTKGATKLYNGADKVSTASTKYQEFDDLRQGNIKQLAIDKGLDHTYLSGDKVADRFKVGEDGVDEAEKTLTQTKLYSRLRDHGVPDDISKEFSFGDEVPHSLAHDNPTRGDIDSALKGQAGEVNQARTRAVHVGKPVSTGIDDLTDPLKDKIKDTLAPEPDSEPVGAGG